MEDYSEEKQVVTRIRSRFPNDAKRTDDWLKDRGWNREESDDAPHIWVEAFTDRTTEAARSHDWDLVTEHTEFMAAEYRSGSERVRKLVDVAYAENLMWNLDGGGKRNAWPYIAKEVRDLYERMWGFPESSESK